MGEGSGESKCMCRDCWEEKNLSAQHERELRVRGIVTTRRAAAG